MAFEKKPEPKPDKWEVIYEDDECIQIWKYNSKKTTFGPVEVETRWKKLYNPWDKKKKTLGDLARESKNKKTK
jgi:hypothetical protein